MGKRKSVGGKKWREFDPSQLVFDWKGVFCLYMSGANGISHLTKKKWKFRRNFLLSNHKGSYTQVPTAIRFLKEEVAQLPKIETLPACVCVCMMDTPRENQTKSPPPPPIYHCTNLIWLNIFHTQSLKLTSKRYYTQAWCSWINPSRNNRSSEKPLSWGLTFGGWSSLQQMVGDCEN